MNNNSYLIEPVSFSVMADDTRTRVGIRICDDEGEALTIVLNGDAAEHLAVSLRFCADYVTGLTDDYVTLTMDQVASINATRREHIQHELANV